MKKLTMIDMFNNCRVLFLFHYCLPLSIYIIKFITLGMLLKWGEIKIIINNKKINKIKFLKNKKGIFPFKKK